MAKRIMQEVYDMIRPGYGKYSASGNPEAIWNEKVASCGGYSIVFKWKLEKEGIASRMVSVDAKFVSPKTKKEYTGQHALIEVKIGEGWILFDPTCNIFYDKSFEYMLSHPELAKEIVDKSGLLKSKRWKDRYYYLYTIDLFKNIISYNLYYTRPLNGVMLNVRRTNS